MPEWIVPPLAGLIEPSVAPEFFVNDIAGAELVGGNVRAYYSADQLPLEVQGGKAQRVVQVKLIWPAYRLPMVMGRWGQGFAAICERQPVSHDGGPWPRLVR